MIWAIVGIAVAVLGGALIAAISRRSPTTPAIDPFTVGEPWRRHVSQALRLQRGYAELVEATAEGPLRDRMADIGRQVNQAVGECFTIAQHGDGLDGTLRTLDAPGLRTRLARTDDAMVRSSLSTQLASADRLREIRDNADRRLTVLTTRMGELLSQGAEVRVGGDVADELGSGVDDVVIQLQALREAVADVELADRATADVESADRATADVELADRAPADDDQPRQMPSP